MGAFKEPHGGELKDLYLDAEAAEAEKQAAQDFLAFITGKKGETEQAAYWFENLGYSFGWPVLMGLLWFL